MDSETWTDPYLAHHRTYYVRVWRDGYWLPWILGTRYPVERQRLIAAQHTNCNHQDPRSLMSVLVKAVKFDRYRGELHTLSEYSLDVWVPDEFGEEGARPLLENWRYTPDMAEASEDAYR